MQDVRVANHFDVDDSYALVVDPSLYGNFGDGNSNLQGKNSQKSKARNKKWLPFGCPMASDVYCNAFLEKTLVQSEASHTTSDPFGYYLESSDCESQNPAVAISEYGVGLDKALRTSRTMPRSKLRMQHKVGLQTNSNVVRTKVAANSSPADFAAAWTHAASNGAWKREGRNRRSVSQNHPPQEQENLATEKEERYVYDAGDTKDMPLPKWFAPAKQKRLPLFLEASVARDHGLLAVVSQSIEWSYQAKAMSL
jgi:hypothetical protein